MEFLSSWPAKVRAAHYQSEASRFHLMAEAEPSDRVRNQLLSVSQQYQQLADSLNAGGHKTAGRRPNWD